MALATSCDVFGKPIAYDARGNVTGRGSQGYYFDQGNRLQLAHGIASYFYDGWGRRTVTSATNGVYRTQLYSKQGVLLFDQTQQGMSVWNTRYVHLGSKLIAETTNNVTAYAHTDALGSPVARTNPAGGLISRTRYEAYGATAAGTNPGSNGFTGIGFTGHVNDPDTALVYMQQRYYDPVARRFLSVDPVTTDANSGSAFNRYAYANNSPYVYSDPDGREPKMGECGWATLQCAIYTAPGYTEGKRGSVLEAPDRQTILNQGGCLTPTVDCAEKNAALFGVYKLREREQALGYLESEAMQLAATVPLGRVVGAAMNGAAAAGTIFKTSHYATRLEAAGLSVTRVEAAVAKEVNLLRGNLAINADVAGRLTVDGIKIEYRARLLPSGTANVGTIFPVK